jgi:hypothetical protein
MKLHCVSQDPQQTFIHVLWTDLFAPLILRTFSESKDHNFTFMQPEFTNCISEIVWHINTS